MSSHIDRMKEWIDGFGADVEVVKKLVAAREASAEARRLGAGALGYLVTRLDLIPDWEEACGVVDDAMVLRAAVMLATEKDLGNLPAELVRGLGRLANEAEVVQDFLGADLWPRFKKHVQRLPDKVVRGRSAAQIVDDELARAALFKEVGDELKSLPPAPVKDAEAVARTVRSYLQTKLAKEA